MKHSEEAGQINLNLNLTTMKEPIFLKIISSQSRETVRGTSKFRTLFLNNSGRVSS
jgi:hypothetical protein